MLNPLLERIAMTLKKTASFVTLLLLMWTASAANAQDLRTGTLKSVVGEVSLVNSDGARSAQTGGGVLQADRIVTGRYASTSLTLKDGTVLTVGPSTTLELTKLQFDSTTQEGSLALNLVQGSIRVVTGWLAKIHPDQVKVTTPTSVVGVRGTDFIVEVP